jgi:hypothetical protein
MDKEVLVICPSRGRPQMLGEMIESFRRTSKISQIIVCLDADDPLLSEYGKIPFPQQGEWIYTYKEQLTTTEIINDTMKKCLGEFKFFSITNDDFIYHTDGWDEKLTEEIKSHGKVGIAYGNDLLQGKQMPTTSVISREIVTALGWLQLPTLTHLYGDNVWQHLGRAAGCIHYRPDVIIEHRHYFSKKVPADATFQRTNSHAMYNRDNQAFRDWIANQASHDIECVRNLITTLQ